MWQRLKKGCVVIGALALLASYAGEVHPVGDSLAAFRPLILIGVIVAVLVSWPWRTARFVGTAALLLGGYQGAHAVLHEGPKERIDLTLYQKNLLYRANDRSALIADIAASRADIITLQEVSRANLSVVSELSAQYPHQLLCGDFTVGQIAILSRFPLRGETCSDTTGFARAIVAAGGALGDVQVISVHLLWPWPFAQQDQTRDLVAEMATFDSMPTVVGGDFNMVPQGRSVAWVEQVLGVARIGPEVPTFWLKGYPMAIDHVFATWGRGLMSVQPRFASDHHGILARVELPR